MYWILLVLTFSISVFNTSGQDFSFYKENITMKIDSCYFYVNGIYYLKGEKYSNKTLIYPFPVNSMYGKVDSVYFFNLSSNKAITPKKNDNNHAVFKIDFGLLNEVIIQVSYRQKLLATRAEYILKSTKSWKKPLDQANYQLIIPANINLFKFSIPPQDSIFTTKEVIYYWEKHNYLPSENLIFEYKIE